MPHRIHSTNAERQRAYRNRQKTQLPQRDWAVEVHRPGEWVLLVDQLPEAQAREVAAGVTINLGVRARAFQLGAVLLTP